MKEVKGAEEEGKQSYHKLTEEDYHSHGRPALACSLPMGAWLQHVLYSIDKMYRNEERTQKKLNRERNEEIPKAKHIASWEHYSSKQRMNQEGTWKAG